MLGQITKSDLIGTWQLKSVSYNFKVKNQENTLKSKEVLTSLENEMRQFDDNYLELAVSYLNDGLFDDAEEVLLRFNGKNPFFDYYLGYIQDKQGNKEKAKASFKKASEYPVDYIFPYRFESAEVLKKVLEYNPADGKAYYYLGNIFYEKQPELAMSYWERASAILALK